MPFCVIFVNKLIITMCVDLKFHCQRSIECHTKVTHMDCIEPMNAVVICQNNTYQTISSGFLKQECVKQSIY